MYNNELNARTHTYRELPNELQRFFILMIYARDTWRKWEFFAFVVWQRIQIEKKKKNKLVLSERTEKKAWVFAWSRFKMK